MSQMDEVYSPKGNHQRSNTSYNLMRAKFGARDQVGRKTSMAQRQDIPGLGEGSQYKTLNQESKYKNSHTQKQLHKFNTAVMTPKSIKKKMNNFLSDEKSEQEQKLENLMAFDTMKSDK